MIDGHALVKQVLLLRGVPEVYSRHILEVPLCACGRALAAQGQVAVRALATASGIWFATKVPC